MNKKLLILVGKINNQFEEIIKNNISGRKVLINPEKSLSIKEQFEFANVIAERISEGNNILLVTESDYILREINNYIMLSKAEGGIKQDLLTKYNIKEEYTINYDEVYGYEIYNNELIELEVIREGVISQYLNDMINYMNNKSDDIFYSIIENESE